MSREGQAKVLTDAELKRVLLMASQGQLGLRNCALLYCSFGLGLRVKEIASLAIFDVTDSNCKLLDEVNLKGSVIFMVDKR
jgi:integrase/recombinase XerD